MLERLKQTDDVAIALTINGTARTVRCSPFAPLVHTLRDRLGLTGTKTGCDAGDCGACTVIMNGAQVCACLVSSAQADGAEIVTVEGAAANPMLARLQVAFAAHGAAQCGICIPGMLTAALDLLARDAKPDRRAVEDALGGVLCRCTGYLKIVDAVMDAAHGAEASIAVAPDAGAAVGARLMRTDATPKVTGAAIFGADAMPADTLWLRAVRSPHPRARFTLGDLDAVVASTPGLEAILTARDVPGHNGYGIFAHLREQPVFADGEARFRGDPVLALVGSRAALAAIDVDDLPIDWEPRDPVIGLDAAINGGLKPVHERYPDNVLIRGRVVRGDAEAAHRDGAATVEANYETGYVEHAYIEPEAGFARIIEGTPGRIEIFASTQAPYMDREEVANVLGIEPDRVRIRPSACGGGFGGKLDVSCQPMLAVAAWTLGRPVTTVYSRIESMASSTKRHPARITGRLSADSDGRFTAFTGHADCNTGAYSSWGPTVAGRIPVHAAGPYRVDHARNTSCAWFTNENPSGAFRGFGVPQAAFAHEGLIDEIADRLGIDRLEIRHMNAIRAGDTTVTGQVLEQSCGLAACFDALRDDWAEMLADAERHNAACDGRTRRGAGIACMWYGCGNTSMSNPSTMRLTLGPDGRLTLYNGAVDIGQGSATVLLQICADALGVPVSAFDQVTGDTDLTEDAGKTSASRQTLVSGNAARLAGEALRGKILARANVGAGARIRLDGPRLHIEDGEARRTIDLGDIEGDTAFEAFGRYDPPTTALDENGQGTPYATYGFAAQICDLCVDTRLGTVKLHRFVAAHDVGRAVNPTLVEGQVHGGIAQGIGMALMEEYLPGKTENLHDYLIPTVGDVPEITVRIIEDPEREGPFGAKGIGEPALVPTAPAILGAIRHATGVTIPQVPVLPHRLWQALRDRERTQ